MKKTIIALFMLLFASVSFAETKYDVLEKEPEANSPAGVVVKFVRALKIGDKESCKKLFDEKAMKWYTDGNGIFLDDAIKRASLYKLDKKFQIRVRGDQNGSILVSIKTKKDGRPSNVSGDFLCKEINGVWKITYN